MDTIILEVKKAIDLWMDKTYNESEFYSHILQIIKDNSTKGDEHKNQLERLMFKVEELMNNQRLYHGGDRSLLGTCKAQESALFKKVMNLKTIQCYDSDRFKVTKPTQKQFF